MILVGVDILEGVEQLLVGFNADGAEQDGDRHLALAVDLDREDVAVGRLELEPGAAVRDQLGGGEPLAGAGIETPVEVGARRADELRDDDAHGPVNNEGAVGGHHREVAQEDAFRAGFLDLAGFLHDQLGRDVEWRGIGDIALAGVDLGDARIGHGAIAFLALRHALPGWLEARVEDGEFHLLVMVGDGGNFVEKFAESLFDKPLEGLDLDLNQVGHFEHGWDVGIGLAADPQIREHLSLCNRVRRDACPNFTVYSHLTLLMLGEYPENQDTTARQHTMYTTPMMYGHLTRRTWAGGM